MSEPVLAVEGLTRHFGGLTALARVSFQVLTGTITGLIGPNGAGKTTAFNLISGTLAPSDGRVLFQGEPVTGRPPHQIVRRGLARTFQATTIFPGSTVRENVVRGAMLRHPVRFFSALLHGAAARDAQRRALAAADAVMEETGLAPYAELPAGTLAYGHQKRLCVAIGLATRPALLLLDEPAAGLNPEEIRAFGELLREIRERHRLTVLVVEHHMRLIMSLCDHIVVLDHGEKIAEGVPSAIQRDEKVIEAYLGKDHVSTA